VLDDVMTSVLSEPRTAALYDFPAVSWLLLLVAVHSGNGRAPPRVLVRRLEAAASPDAVVDCNRVVCITVERCRPGARDIYFISLHLTAAVWALWRQA